jgi:hypothetical protein
MVLLGESRHQQECLAKTRSGVVQRVAKAVKWMNGVTITNDDSDVANQIAADGKAVRHEAPEESRLLKSPR